MDLIKALHDPLVKLWVSPKLVSWLCSFRWSSLTSETLARTTGLIPFCSCSDRAYMYVLMMKAESMTGSENSLSAF